MKQQLFLLVAFLVTCSGRCHYTERRSSASLFRKNKNFSAIVTYLSPCKCKDNSLLLTLTRNITILHVHRPSMTMAAAILVTSIFQTHNMSLKTPSKFYYFIGNKSSMVGCYKTSRSSLISICLHL